MQTTLAEVAKVIRSKNAGPFWLTLEVMFEDPEVYRQCPRPAGRDAGEDRTALQPATRAGARFAADSTLAVKASMPRVRSPGSPGDSGVFGRRQYAPLLGLEGTLEDGQR